MGSIPCQEIFLNHFLHKKKNFACKRIFQSAVGIICKVFNGYYRNQIFLVLNFYLLAIFVSTCMYAVRELFVSPKINLRKVNKSGGAFNIWL